MDAAKEELRNHKSHAETLAAIEQAEAFAEARPRERRALRLMGKGFVAEEALAIGLYCALTARDFEDGIILAVNHSGDSDSTGSISGNLLGAASGVEAIPERWLSNLELRTTIEALAEDRKSTRLNSSHLVISYAVFCLKKKKNKHASSCAHAYTP